MSTGHRIEASTTKKLATINPEVQPSGTGCVECLKMGPPQWWLHLRRCAECGHIGCCDNSPNKHATHHYHSTKHAIIQSFEKEDNGWFFDYRTDQIIKPGVKLANPQYHPVGQTVPFSVE